MSRTGKILIGVFVVLALILGVSIAADRMGSTPAAGKVPAEPAAMPKSAAPAGPTPVVQEYFNATSDTWLDEWVKEVRQRPEFASVSDAAIIFAGIWSTDCDEDPSLWRGNVLVPGSAKECLEQARQVLAAVQSGSCSTQGCWPNWSKWAKENVPKELQ